MCLNLRVAGPFLVTGSFILGSAACPFAGAQQAPPWVGSIQDPAQFAKAQSLADTLNDEAKAGDSAGIHRYCEHLVRLLVPPRAGQKYIRSFTDRLARAEEAARAGKGKLVPKTKIVEAYNNLMRKVGAPTSLLTNETAVRNLRLVPFDKPGDALITTDRNGTNCNPGEAMYLLLSLFWNNGGPRVPLEKAPGTATPRATEEGRWVTLMTVRPSDPSASRSVHLYAEAHRPRQTANVFNEVAKTLGL